MAHFLGGRLVRVVWCEFKSESGHWKKAHLLLSTDAKLTPEQIIEAYGERWSIESMFNRCQAWRAKRGLVDPSSREAALFSRRALCARGKTK